MIGGFNDEGLKRIETSFRSEVEQRHTVGAVISIARNGKSAFMEALGFQDRERGMPMGRDCIFRIASMTKPIVAVATLMLVEEGLLALSDPIDQYLREFKDMQVGSEYRDRSNGARRLSLAPAQNPITILDLLRHTSGLTTALFGGSAVRQMYQESRIRDDQQSNEELSAKLAGLPLLHQPGTTFEYSMSTDVLGRLIEVISGKDLNSFVIERIADPLGMKDTAFLLSALNHDRLAMPQRGPTDNSILAPYDVGRPPRWFSGGSGVLSTAPDFTRFCQMLLNRGCLDGIRVLSRKSVELMCSDQLPPHIAFGPNTKDLGITAPLPEYGQSYGLGIGIRTRPGLSPVLGSVGDFYWGGALGTYFWIDPCERLIAVLMMQELDLRKRARYRSLFRNLVYHALGD